MLFFRQGWAVARACYHRARPYGIIAYICVLSYLYRAHAGRAARPQFRGRGARLWAMATSTGRSTRTA